MRKFEIRNYAINRIYQYLMPFFFFFVHLHRNVLGSGHVVLPLRKCTLGSVIKQQPLYFLAASTELQLNMHTVEARDIEGKITQSLSSNHSLIRLQTYQQAPK